MIFCYPQTGCGGGLPRAGAYQQESIRTYIEDEFGYDLSQTPDELRPNYAFDVTCQGTVPPALSSFVYAEDFEDAVRNAVSLGGDSDTLACIAGAVAGAFYGVPADIEEETLARLDTNLTRVIAEFETRFRRA